MYFVIVVYRVMSLCSVLSFVVYKLWWWIHLNVCDVVIMTVMDCSLFMYYVCLCLFMGFVLIYIVCMYVWCYSLIGVMYCDLYIYVLCICVCMVLLFDVASYVFSQLLFIVCVSCYVLHCYLVMYVYMYLLCISCIC